MNQEFWLERWQFDQIGFHCEVINPNLQSYWSQLKINSGSQVFVPLCGKSKDLLWLKSQGCEVVGVELSPLAVSAFFEENNLSPTITQEGDFTVYKEDGFLLYVGDYFNLSAKHLANISAVYDRASLVALPPDMRPAYTQHLQTLLNAGTKILLVTFNYAQPEMQGPPFSVPEAEIAMLYSDWCDINLLCTNDILEQEPRFRDRGLTRLQEQVYLITVK